MLSAGYLPGPLQPVSLADLASLEFSSLLPPHGVYRARILSVRPWSPHTRLGQIGLGGATSGEAGDAVVVELKGLWADKAMRRFRKGDVAILLTKGADVIEAKGKKRAGAAEKEQAVRLRYSRGLTGWIRRMDGSEEVLRYEGASRSSNIIQLAHSCFGSCYLEPGADCSRETTSPSRSNGCRLASSSFDVQVLPSTRRTSDQSQPAERRLALEEASAAGRAARLGFRDGLSSRTIALPLLLILNRHRPTK